MSAQELRNRAYLGEAEASRALLSGIGPVQIGEWLSVAERFHRLADRADVAESLVIQRRYTCDDTEEGADK